MTTAEAPDYAHALVADALHAALGGPENVDPAPWLAAAAILVPVLSDERIRALAAQSQAVA